MKKRKTPMRMCIGCREMKPKAELIRIVQPKEGDVHTDATGKAQGRGSYLCPQESCLQAAMKSKAVKLPVEVIEALRQEIAQRVQ